MSRFEFLLQQAHEMMMELYEDDEIFNLITNLNETQFRLASLSLMIHLMMKLDSEMKLDSGTKVGLNKNED